MEEDLRGERACPPACLRAGRVPPWPSGMPDITSLPGGGGRRERGSGSSADWTRYTCDSMATSNTWLGHWITG